MLSTSRSLLSGSGSSSSLSLCRLFLPLVPSCHQHIPIIVDPWSTCTTTKALTPTVSGKIVAGCPVQPSRWNHAPHNLSSSLPGSSWRTVQTSYWICASPTRNLSHLILPLLFNKICCLFFANSLQNLVVFNRSDCTKKGKQEPSPHCCQLLGIQIKDICLCEHWPCSEHLVSNSLLQPTQANINVFQQTYA